MASKGMRYLMGIVFFSCALTALVGGTIARAAQGGPERTVRTAQKAIDARDMALLDTCLDLESLTIKAVDLAVTDDSVMQSVEKYPAAAVVLALGSASGANEAIRTMLANEVVEYVRHGVTSGAFAGQPVADASVYRGIFSKAFRGERKDRVLFGPATVTKKDASSATVTTTLVHGDKGRTYPLELLARQRDGAWRIVEILNMPELLREATRRKK